MNYSQIIKIFLCLLEKICLHFHHHNILHILNFSCVDLCIANNDHMRYILILINISIIFYIINLIIIIKINNNKIETYIDKFKKFHFY